MEQRLSVITVGVSNLSRSREFYARGLGWKPFMDTDEIVFFQLNGIVLGLFPLEAFSKDAGVPLSAASPGTIALAYNVRDRSDVDPLMAKAASAGAKITKPPKTAEWGGYSGYFADPDGHLWEVAWNPGWPIDSDGNITAT